MVKLHFTHSNLREPFLLKFEQENFKIQGEKFPQTLFATPMLSKIKNDSKKADDFQKGVQSFKSQLKNTAMKNKDHCSSCGQNNHLRQKRITIDSTTGTGGRMGLGPPFFSRRPDPPLLNFEVCLNKLKQHN